MDNTEEALLERKQKEQDFHNKREADRKVMSDEEYERKYSNKRFYKIAKSSNDYLYNLISELVPGKVALDYCCGLGFSSLELAKRGAKHVHGIDISNESVDTSRQRLIDAGFGDSSTFQTMDAEKMTFEDNTFDLILCSGVLHHLDLQFAYPELARVLKPDGKIIAIEALGYNPAINLYRKMTPSLRTEWETDHILTLAQVKEGLQFFNNYDVKYFHLASIAAIPFIKTPVFKPLLAFLEALDWVLLKIPFVQLMAWQMIFVLKDPKQ